jgi:DNA polymerase III subunit alpha
MKQFVHLHSRSEFSICRATSKVKDLASFAYEQSMPAIALTDEETLAGTLAFRRAFGEIDGTAIHVGEPPKPIIGCDFCMPANKREREWPTPRTPGRGLVLISCSDEGYRNLCRLSSPSLVTDPRELLIDQDVLGVYRKGLVALSGGINGRIPSLILQRKETEALALAGRYRELFGAENFFLELTDHGTSISKTLNQGLVRLAGKLESPLVATNDTYYSKKDDWEAHDILLCMGSHTRIDDSDRPRLATREHWLKSAEEMALLFGHIPGALENTLKIAEMVDPMISLPGPILPIFPVPVNFDRTDRAEINAFKGKLLNDIELETRISGKTVFDPDTIEKLDTPSAEYLIWLCLEGVKARYGKNPRPEVTQRLESELLKIIMYGYADYFLIVQDYVNYAKERGIPVGLGRGSAAGSLINYALKITDIDPIRYSLLFECFFNFERAMMPDIDIDFSFDFRDEIVNYVRARYGVERVAGINTFGRLKAETAITEVAYAFRLSDEEVNEALRLGERENEIDDSPEMWTTINSGNLASSEGIRKLISVSSILRGQISNSSIHLAGIVIGRKILTNFMPLRFDSQSGTICTQYDPDAIPACGLVKFDLLGLRTLDSIKQVLARINKSSPIISISDIPTNDMATFSLFCDGNTSGVFQFESYGMREILLRAQPSTFEELVVLNALFRPSVMDLIDRYIDTGRSPASIEYLDPHLESILRDTRGIIVYQEQIIEAIAKLAGYSLTEADLLLWFMKKKNCDKLPARRTEFIARCRAYNVEDAIASAIFDILASCAPHAFNKSHAVAYTMHAYRSAFLKAHYPKQFNAVYPAFEMKHEEA